MRTKDSLRLFLVTVLLTAVGTGCGKKELSPHAAKVAAAAAKPAPERSFELIIDSFRHSMEDTRIGFVMYDKGGHSMLVGQRKVSEELIRPKDGGPYKAIITVVSESRYSMQRPQDEPQDAEDNQDAEQDAAKTDTGETDPNGVEVIDSNLVSKPGESGARKSPGEPVKSKVSRRPDVDTRKYELVYDAGRWVLVTKLDPKTEQSIQHAFDIALKTQS